MRFEKKNAVRLIRNGRRVYGGIYRLPDGREVYIAYRRQDEIFRGGEKSIKDAMDKGVAAWALDYDTLIRLRTEGVYLVGIQTKETGDLYLTTLGEFNKAPMLNYASRGGALQRYLPLDKFLVQLGSVKPVKKATRRGSAAVVV